MGVRGGTISSVGKLSYAVVIRKYTTSERLRDVTTRGVEHPPQWMAAVDKYCEKEEKRKA